MTRAVIKGWGTYLPKTIVYNDYFSFLVDTSDQWIQERTGITQRRIAERNELTSDMAVQATYQACQNATIDAKDIDLIILATTTPDKIMPSTATIIQARLNNHKACAFDVQAACCGFIYALSVAESFISSKKASRVLVIGADKMSSIINWYDRNTCVLFGDGAGAAILCSESTGGIISSHIYSDGSLANILCTDTESKTITMQGREVFKHAVNKLVKLIVNTIAQHSITLDKIAFLVPHQANKRIVDAIARSLHINEEQIVSTIFFHANTSAASIPLAFDTIKHKLKQDDIVLLFAIGSGLTWGSVLLQC